MFTYTSDGSMKLHQGTAQEIIDRLLKRGEPVFQAGTPEEIHHMTSAIKDVIDIMATEEEK